MAKKLWNTKGNPTANGAVIWSGESEIDGSPIVAIVTGLRDDSTNVKTGAMLQVWILRRDMLVLDALKTGADYAICGNCPHRAGSCYVDTGKAPQGISRAYLAGSYPVAEPTDFPRLFGGALVRFGAYGDPAAVPVWVWAAIAEHAKGWTGYTHQWRTAAATLADYCMASCDSPEDYAEAQQAGWRTFRTRLAGEELRADEIQCPASDEGGNKTQCARCGLCSGATGKGRIARNIAIIAHGAPSKVKAYAAFRGIAIAAE